MPKAHLLQGRDPVQHLGRSNNSDLQAGGRAMTFQAAAANMTWRDVGLIQRILAPIVFTILLSSAVQSYFDVRSGSNEARARLSQEAQQLLEVLVPVVAENVVVGDYATLKERLDRQVQVQEEVARIVWRTPGGEYVAKGASTRGLAPRWFRNWAAIQPVDRSHEVTLGGIAYGVLSVHVTSMVAENRLWVHVIEGTSITAATMLAIIAMTSLLLRANLNAVHRLAEGANRLRNRDLDVRLRLSGAPELRSAIDAFNRLAGQLQASLRELADNKKRLDEQLHFTQELIQVLPNPVFYMDADGRFLGVNAAWENFFGVARGQVIGKGLSALGLRDGPAMVAMAAHDADLLSNLGMRVYEAIHKASDGSDHHLMYAKAAFTTADGRPAGLIGVITDLTAVKRAEQEARNALVDKVRAESANEAKSAFLANMSHEIRTPLTAVIGFGESLFEADTTMQERIDAIHTIVRAGKHLQHLINDVLDLSKIEAGRMVVECVAIPIGSLVADVAAFAAPQAQAKGIRFDVKYESPIPEEISTDPLRLKQILLNLVSNAIKFTQEGHVHLRIACDVEHCRMRFQVIDTGIGLTSEQIGRLFRPFEQANLDTSRKFGGTGLGLHLSKRFAQLLGGDLTVHSEPGQGSCFTVVVSTEGLTSTTLTHDLPLPSQNVLANKMPQTLRLTGRVLLAEDNADNQRLMSLHLRRVGIEPIIAPDGESALRRATAEAFDLILMDIQMPIMDGMEATRRLRNLGYKVPIVALTADAMQQDCDRCLEAGCDAFLTKPIERDQFIATLLSFLQPSHSHGTQQPDNTPILSMLLENDPTFAELVGRFVNQLPGIIAAIEQLTAAEDWETLRGRLHELKGAGGGYGFPQLSTTAGRMNFALSAGDYAGVRDLLDELKNLRDRILSGASASVLGTQKAIEASIWP